MPSQFDPDTGTTDNLHNPQPGDSPSGPFGRAAQDTAENDAIEAIEAAEVENRTNLVSKAGATFIGPVVLAADPTAPLEPVTYRSSAVVFNPSKYGAVGDGTTDDTAAIQSTFDAAAVNGGTVQLTGTYRTTGMLYFYGSVDFVGTGTLLLDAVLPVHSTDEYWIFLGLKPDTTADTWSGTIGGVTFKTTANASTADFVTMMCPWNVSHGTIERCVFDSTASSPSKVGGIRGQANSGFSTATFTVEDLKIDKNRLIAAQNASGNEGISISGFNGTASDIRVTNNYVFGWGDDAIAMHAVTGFSVQGNKCYSTDGRILNDSSADGEIVGNHIERIPTQDGTNVWANGSGLLSTVATAASLPAPKNTTFSGNTCLFGLAGTAEAAFQVTGGRGITYAGNTVVNPPGAAANFPSNWKTSPLTGWVDPDGLDPNGTVLVRNLKLAGNNYVAYAAMGRSGASGTDSVNVIHDLPSLSLSQATAPGSINAGSANVFRYTLTGNWGATAIINGAFDQEIEISFIQDSTGGRTYSWPTSCKFAGGSAPPPSTAAGAIDCVAFRYDGTNWQETRRSARFTPPPKTVLVAKNPAGTISTTAVMCGLNCTYTPSSTGKVLVRVVGQGATSTAVALITAAITSGTGTPPSNGDVVSGTTISASVFIRPPVAQATAVQPFELVGNSTGLALGTPRWFDVSFLTSSASDQASLQGVSITVEEYS